MPSSRNKRNAKELKYILCLFKMEKSETFRAMIEGTTEQLDKHLNTQLGKNKIVEKRLFEIDRLTGNLEEF